MYLLENIVIGISALIITYLFMKKWGEDNAWDAKARDHQSDIYLKDYDDDND